MTSERKAFAVIGVLSGAILVFLIWLIYGRAQTPEAPAWTASLPALNAALNSLCAVFLLAGVVAIRRGRRELHMKLVLTALVVSVAFLASYVTYHHFQGDTKFLSQGPVRSVYFFVLVSHIVLSIVVVPMVLTTLFFAGTEQFSRHRKIARLTFPVWLYVSVTGVLVFALLKGFG